MPRCSSSTALFRRALDERAALLAALLLPTSVLWLDKVPSAEIDMTLVGWVTAALVLFHRAIESKSAVWWLLSLLCVAVGTLTKWTAPAFFYLTVIPLLAWRGELRLLFGWRHLLACGVAVGVCALWAVAVAQQVGWETLIDTVRSEAAYRFAPKSAAKGYPWLGSRYVPAARAGGAPAAVAVRALDAPAEFLDAVGRPREVPSAIAPLLDVAEPALLVAGAEPQRALRAADEPGSDGLGGDGGLGLVFC